MIRLTPKSVRSLREAFGRQRRDAIRSGKGFQLSFEQWLSIWIRSGHLHERGRGRGKYVMARFGDRGPYAVGNVKIITHSQNLKERVYSEEFLVALSKRMKGNKTALGHKHSPKVLAKIKAARVGQTPNLGNRGYSQTEQSKANISAGLRAWAKRRRRQQSAQP